MVAMLGWLRRRRPLTGAPAVRRVKTHSADSGYVYQYYYEGQRAAGGGVEYVFSASSDRTQYFPVVVVLTVEAVQAWERDRGRELSGPERYGIAKIALRQAFDERAEPRLMRGEVRVRAEDIGPIAAMLGLE
jgi:hypothetical protein